MKGILILSLKNIWRKNRIVLLFLFIIYTLLLYFSFYTKDLREFVRDINLALPYSCLLLTGGQLKDEIKNGYLDVILHRIERWKVVIGKFSTIFLSSIIFYSILFITIIVFTSLYGSSENLKPIFISLAKGFIVTIYLISAGLFLSLFSTGYFNFAFIFFLNVFSIVFIEFFSNIFTQLENSGVAPGRKLFYIYLLSPNFIQLTNDTLIISGILISSLFFLLLTIYIFKRVEIKKG